MLLDTTDPNISDYIQLLEKITTEENVKISNIIATHWHHDHIGSIEDVKARKLVSADCKFWKFPRSDANEDYGSLEFLELKDGQEFDVDGRTFKVLHTPGHTTDHAILFDTQSRAVFSGDCILGEGTAIFEDLYDYMNTIKLILQLNPSVIYPGHGNIIEDPIQRIEYYINHRNERERQILDALTCNEPLTDMEIVKIVYDATPNHLWPAAAVNVNQHLIKLAKEGKIVKIDNGSRVGKNHSVYWKAANTSNKL